MTGAARTPGDMHRQALRSGRNSWVGRKDPVVWESVVFDEETQCSTQRRRVLWSDSVTKTLLSFKFSFYAKTNIIGICLNLHMTAEYRVGHKLILLCEIQSGEEKIKNVKKK